MAYYNRGSMPRCLICSLPLLIKEDGKPEPCHNPTCCTPLCFCEHNIFGDLVNADRCPAHSPMLLFGGI